MSGVLSGLDVSGVRGLEWVGCVLSGWDVSGVLSVWDLSGVLIG